MKDNEQKTNNKQAITVLVIFASLLVLVIAYAVISNQ